MHGVTLKLKRAHLQAVAFGKDVLKTVEDMTPARFDLLYAIRNRWVSSLGPYRMAQNELRETLGLHPSTVSKMVKRLVQLGWVTTDAAMHDARVRLVILTELGQGLIEEAMKIVDEGRMHRTWFELFFAKMTVGEVVIDAIGAFWEMTEAMAVDLGDTSTLAYDFGYQPFDDYFDETDDPDRPEPYPPGRSEAVRRESASSPS